MSKPKPSSPSIPKIEIVDGIEDVYYANVYNATVTPHGDIRIDLGQDRPLHSAADGTINKVERCFERGLYLSIPVAKQLGEGLLKIIENLDKGMSTKDFIISQTEGNA